MKVDSLSVDIIIPNWNGKKFLQVCLQSILAGSAVPSNIIVVDNGSSDDSVDFLREHYPQVQVICFGTNTGFSAAVNAGICAGRNPLVFLLNNDTELAPDCLSHLVAATKRYDQGFFAAKMLSFDERTVLDGAGDGYLRGGAGYRLGTMEQDGPDYDSVSEVFGACAGAVLYRRRMLEDLGPFDEDFFAYLEDVDCNLRANRAGYSCLYVPEARVYHIGSATTGSKINPVTVRLSTRNSLFILAKHYSFLYLIRTLPVICIYQLFWFLFVLKKNQLLPYLQGIFQAIRGCATMRAKQQAIREKDRITEAELSCKLREAERSVVTSIMRRRKDQGKGNGMLRCYQTIFLK